MKPFKVEPEFEMRDTPKSYRSYPGGKNLPAELKVWRIQNTPPEKTAGVVNAPSAFNGKDSEVLAYGYNDSKEFRSVAIGRHKNFLQWGFDGSPSSMTKAGKMLFINCVIYISKHDSTRL